jgi:glutathione peroxidase
MKRFLLLITAAMISSGLISATSAYAQSKEKPMETSSKLYSFTMKTIDGKERSLSEYKGKVVLIVNVASKCGYTPQYKGLQEVYLKYKDKGFVILGFPANNFLWQEPGSDQDIQQFCSTNYNVTFDMFSKISVKGEDQNPLYTYLTRESESPNEVKWNFNKFLVDKTGKVVSYFPSSVEPTSEALTKKIEGLLATK